MAKTTFKVRAKQWEFFNHECKVMSLRRDGFITRVLPEEIKLLNEIDPCDAVGAKWLKDRWVTMWGTRDIELINAPVMLSDDVLNSLNQTCAEKNVPRDAFVDCFLVFLTGRLIDAAVVIKDPRTDRDLASQVVAVRNEEDIDDNELGLQLLDATNDWAKKRNTALWGKALYRERLVWNAEKVEVELEILELFTDEHQKTK